MQKKQCNKCLTEKDITDFHKKPTGKYGVMAVCKECISPINMAYNAENKEKQSAYAKIYRQEHSEYEKKRHAKYYRDNLGKRQVWLNENKKSIKEGKKRWNDKNIELIREKTRANKKKKRLEDTDYKLKENISGRILRAIKYQGTYKSYSSIKLLGCTIQKAREHLEKQFQPGMTWKNHGLKGWHIDHKIPCASFDLTDSEEQKACFNYMNLQPLWWQDNLSKGNKLNYKGRSYA